MDRAFSFRAEPLPFRRRLNPRAIAIAVAAFIVLFGLVSFSRWVTDSERRSLDGAAQAGATTRVVGTIAGRDDEPRGPNLVDDRLAIDATARSDARVALDAARRVAAGRSTFLDAGPGQLGATASALIFVDGPSRAPGVVSVASTRSAWGAAVMGPSGTCYMVRFSPSGDVRYGTGQICTGGAALAVDDPSW